MAITTKQGHEKGGAVESKRVDLKHKESSGYYVIKLNNASGVLIADKEFIKFYEKSTSVRDRLMSIADKNGDITYFPISNIEIIYSLESFGTKLDITEKDLKEIVKALKEYEKKYKSLPFNEYLEEILEPIFAKSLK